MVGERWLLEIDDLSLKETKLHGLMEQANELRGSIVIVFPFFLRAKP